MSNWPFLQHWGRIIAAKSCAFGIVCRKGRHSDGRLAAKAWTSVPGGWHQPQSASDGGDGCSARPGHCSTYLHPILAKFCRIARVCVCVTSLRRFFLQIEERADLPDTVVARLRTPPGLARSVQLRNWRAARMPLAVRLWYGIGTTRCDSVWYEARVTLSLAGFEFGEYSGAVLRLLFGYCWFCLADFFKV